MPLFTMTTTHNTQGFTTNVKCEVVPHMLTYPPMLLLDTCVSTVVLPQQLDLSQVWSVLMRWFEVMKCTISTLPHLTFQVESTPPDS